MENSKPVFERAGLEHPEENGEAGAFGPVAVSDLPEASVTPQLRKGALEWLYFHLTNLPSAVVILSVIAGLAIIGTIVPQKQELADYVRQYGTMKANLLRAFGFHDIYHTLYFNTLLGWISISAIWCSYLRFVRTWKLQFSPRINITGKTIARLKHHRVAKCADEKALMSQLEERLAKSGFRTYKLEHKDGASNLYGSRGMRRMWALVDLHFALIAILLGALINLFFGQHGTIAIDDGETKTLTFQAGEGKPAFVRTLVGSIAPMTFTLHNEKFEITYDKLIKEIDWAKMGANPPEAYRRFEAFIVHQFTSNLTVERNGRKKSKVISVNYPLNLDGLVLYQSAFNRGIELVVKSGDQTFRSMVAMGVPFEITSAGIRAISPGATATSPFVFLIDDIKVGPWYQAGKYMGELTPAAKIRILSSDTAETVSEQVITKDEPLAAPMFSIELGDKVLSTSIFQWKRDPGLPCVYLGFLFVVLGVLGTLYFRFQQVYVRAEKGKVWAAIRSTGIAEDADAYLEGLFAKTAG